MANAVNAIRNVPHSRRIMVSAWNPAEIDDMVLPPCHYGFQIYINNGVMDLMWQQRSVDIFLGLPYDISMYGLLLDCHLYNNHIDQANIYLGRSKRVLPTLELTKGLDTSLEIPKHNEINLIKYNPYPAIKAELSVGK